MVNLLGFNQSLVQLVSSWTNLETSLGAIARLRDFVDKTPSENRPEEIQIPDSTWPAMGAIDLKNISMSYL